MKKILRFLKLVVIPLIIAFGIYSFIRFVWVPNEKREFQYKNIEINDYLNIYYDSKEAVVLVMKDNTEKKGEYEEIIREKFDGKFINVYYLNITSLTENELSQFEIITELDASKKYSLPILVYIINGQPYDILKGYQEPHYVQDFIERNNIK